MKKAFILGLVVTAFAMLIASCNTDRFDFSELEAVEANGHWRLPVGSVYITLENVLGQLGENDLVSYDEDGNLQVYYRYVKDTIVLGADFMTFDNTETPVEFVTDNPYPYVLDEPVEDVLHFEQRLELESDALRLYSAKIRSGLFYFNITSTLGDITKIIVKSANIVDANGDFFERSIQIDGMTPVDLEGFHLETEEENTLVILYDIYYEAYQYTGPTFVIDGSIIVDELRVQELSGYVNNYVTPYRVFDTNFRLPLDNVDGMVDFVEARLMIKQRNSFDLPCMLRIDTAMIFGDNAEVVELFDEYPIDLDVNYSLDYSDLLEQTLRVGLSTKQQQFLSSGWFVMNPEGFDHRVTICDTSTIGISAEGILPMRFNIPGVTYNDTVDVDFSAVVAPEVIQEVQLTLIFDSELPFNLGAQLFTTDPSTGAVTDSLFSSDRLIKGAFDGRVERTEAVVVMSQERLSRLMSSQQMLMRLQVDTEDHDVQLNLEDGIRLTMKVDVLYEGELMDVE